MSKAHEDIKARFDIYDQKGDGKIEGLQIGNIVRSCGLKPTNEALIKAQGQEYKAGERVGVDAVTKAYDALEKTSKDAGGINDFIEVLKVFDREGGGKIDGGELRGTLASLGEQLDSHEVDEITQGLMDADGNIKIKDFCTKITTLPFAE